MRLKGRASRHYEVEPLVWNYILTTVGFCLRGFNIMDTRTEKYCFELGFLTQQRLRNSRMRSWRSFDWESFSALPNFQKVMKWRKMNLKELSAFREGFEKSLKDKPN